MSDVPIASLRGCFQSTMDLYALSSLLCAHDLPAVVTNVPASDLFDAHSYIELTDCPAVVLEQDEEGKYLCGGVCDTEAVSQATKQLSLVLSRLGINYCLEVHDDEGLVISYFGGLASPSN